MFEWGAGRDESVYEIGDEMLREALFLRVTEKLQKGKKMRIKCHKSNNKK